MKASKNRASLKSTLSTVAKPSMSGGSAPLITKVRKIGAPTPPKPGSMASMGNKLRRGDC